MTYINIKLSFLIIFLSAFKDVHLYYMYSLTEAKKYQPSTCCCCCCGQAWVEYELNFLFGQYCRMFKSYWGNLQLRQVVSLGSLTHLLVCHGPQECCCSWLWRQDARTLWSVWCTWFHFHFQGSAALIEYETATYFHLWSTYNCEIFSEKVVAGWWCVCVCLVNTFTFTLWHW